MSGPWSEDVWQSVAQVVPNVKTSSRARLVVESLALVMQNTSLDVADDPEGKYPTSSLQANARRWHQDGTLRSLVSVFEGLGLSKDWPTTLSTIPLVHNTIGLRDLITRTLLEVRGAPVPGERPTPTVRSEDNWRDLFSAVTELSDNDRSRYVLSNLDVLMRDPWCRWSDLEENNRNRVNSTVSNWERRGLLATIIKKLTYQGLTSTWTEVVHPGEREKKRTSIRCQIVKHLKKARKLAAARARRVEQSKLKKPFSWKTGVGTVKAKPGARVPNSMKEAAAQAIVNNSSAPGSQVGFAPLQLSAEEVEMWRTRRQMRKSKSTALLAISRREKERLKKKQRSSR